MNEAMKDRFLKDVANHVMEIYQDDGVYRHIRFRRPGTMCMHFDLITWPGLLCYTGDMGTYVFSRLRDMFEFFRHDKREDQPDIFRWIDRRYWAEKLEASDKHDGVREFDPDAFKREITVQRRKLFLEHGHDMSPEQRTEFWETFNDVFDAADDGESYIYPAVRDWSFTFHKPQDVIRSMKRVDIYLDTDDFPDCKRYTHRFEWCCLALRWGINKYDETLQPCSLPSP